MTGDPTRDNKPDSHHWGGSDEIPEDEYAQHAREEREAEDERKLFAELSPPYATIVADPPWPTGVKGSGYVRGVGRRYGAGGRRQRATSLGYSTMPLEDIYALPVADLAAEDAALWLWVTAGHNRAGVGMACAEAWGFSVVGEFVWAKPNYGMGAFPRPQHEILLVCRRGSVTFDRADVGSVQNWRQDYGLGKRHSSKPVGAYDLIESVSPGPYVELFCRRPVLGWDSWGWGYERNLEVTDA